MYNARTTKGVKQLAAIASRNRRRIVDMVHKTGVGHVGGSLSVIDVLTALYENEVNFESPQRARLVLSKGHCTPALYAEFTEKGLIDEAEYDSFRQPDSKLQGHPCARYYPQIDATTGLLGQGLSSGFGMAMAKRTNGDPHMVYVIVGDGELQEGQNWEALMAIGHYKLHNLAVFIDRNHLSSAGKTDDNVTLEPLEDKLRAFNFSVLTIDGHNMNDILKAIELAKSSAEKPYAIIANTIKGKGVSFMENNPAWHSKGINDEQYQIALEDLARIGADLSCVDASLPREDADADRAFAAKEV